MALQLGTNLDEVSNFVLVGPGHYGFLMVLAE